MNSDTFPASDEVSKKRKLQPLKKEKNLKRSFFEDDEDEDDILDELDFDVDLDEFEDDFDDEDFEDDLYDDDDL